MESDISPIPPSDPITPTMGVALSNQLESVAREVKQLRTLFGISILVLALILTVMVPVIIPEYFATAHFGSAPQEINDGVRVNTVIPKSASQNSSPQNNSMMPATSATSTTSSATTTAVTASTTAIFH